MLKPYDELVKVDVSKWCKERDGIKYLPWAKCLALLYEYGAEKVYFLPITRENGSSLIMSDKEFVDKNGIANRCYEIAIKIFIDDKEYYFQTALMNGSNPVKDNSLTQQRVWNAQTRAFVKGVAIYTGLGFNLWLDEEIKGEENQEEDLFKHQLSKIKIRMEELVTSKLTPEFGVKELAEKIGMTEEEFRARFSYFKLLIDLEKKLMKA